LNPLHRQTVTGTIPNVFEKGLPYDETMVIKDGDCLQGYFPTEKYFAHLRDELDAIFTPRKPLKPISVEWLRKIVSVHKRSVFLCVRRGDYVGNNYHVLLPMEYYRKACQRLKDEVGDCEFFVFSDDLPWCKENLKLDANFVDGYQPAEGMWLMRHCRHAIVANSSYSWWPAWLGVETYGGIVIAPPANLFFGPSCREDARDIMPLRWIR